MLDNILSPVAGESVRTVSSRGELEIPKRISGDSVPTLERLDVSLIESTVRLARDRILGKQRYSASQATLILE